MKPDRQAAVEPPNQRRARDRRPVADVLELKGLVGAAARDGGR
jgi:hypothetical protein